jgi:hypothetical protein
VGVPAQCKFRRYTPRRPLFEKRERDEAVVGVLTVWNAVVYSMAQPTDRKSSTPPKVFIRLAFSCSFMLREFIWKSWPFRRVPVYTRVMKVMSSLYDNWVKQATREIWYGKCLQDENEGGIVMLAGDSPHEVHMAIQHGFRLERITPVEHNFGRLRQFVKRFTDKEEQNYIRHAVRHCEVSEACRDLASEGKYQRVLTLDFCGYAEAPEVRAEIMRCLDSGVLMHGGKLVIEVLNGRETGMIERFGDRTSGVSIAEESRLWERCIRMPTLLPGCIDKPMTPHEVVRLKLLRAATEGHQVSAVGLGKYRNGASPMLWVIYRVKSYKQRRSK